jgi:hypothetical protein
MGSNGSLIVQWLLEASFLKDNTSCPTHQKLPTLLELLNIQMEDISQLTRMLETRLITTTLSSITLEAPVITLMILYSRYLVVTLQELL